MNTESYQFKSLVFFQIINRTQVYRYQELNSSSPCNCVVSYFMVPKQVIDTASDLGTIVQSIGYARDFLTWFFGHVKAECSAMKVSSISIDGLKKILL